jgi:hypothetical protein
MADKKVVNQNEFNKMMITVSRDIRPDQRNDRAADQEQRVARDEIPYTIHAVPPIVPADVLTERVKLRQWLTEIAQ